MHHRRVDGVGLHEGPPLGRGESRRLRHEVDRPGEPLRVDGQARSHLGREPLEQRGVLGGRLGQRGLDPGAMRRGHVAHGTGKTRLTRPT
jgi:hypothetical protein